MKKRGSRSDIERLARRQVRRYGGSLTFAMLEQKVIRLFAIAWREAEDKAFIDGFVKVR